MDKEKTNKKPSFFENVRAAVSEAAARRKNDRSALAVDTVLFLVAFVFARRHLVFGAYPLGAALVAALPTRVWIALIGAVAGSLSLGRIGVIHAGVSVIIIFLRIIISSNAKGESSSLFSEPLIMRLSAATIGSFVGAGYEMLLSGFSFSSVMFGVFTVGLTLGLSFIFSGLFFTEISAADFLYGERTLFKKKNTGGDLGLIFFQGSLAAICLLISFSLSPYNYFGISLAFVFSAVLSLFASKRFGAVRGMAIGFITSVAVTATYSPSFALLGAISGILYPFGIGYGLIGGGVAYSLYGAYAGGLGGFLSLFPEYTIAAVLMYTTLKKVPAEKEEAVCDSLLKTAEEMVGAAWLSEKRDTAHLSSLEEALSSAADKISELGKLDSLPDFEIYRSICDEVIKEQNPAISKEIINKISTKLYKKQKFSKEDEAELESCGITKELLMAVREAAAQYERELYEKRRTAQSGTDYTLISKMINEVTLEAARERSVNENLTSLAKEVFIKEGFPEGSIRVFGDKKIRVIGAGHDPDGRLITSPALKLGLEEALGLRLGSYEYFRKGDMALFKASCVAAYTVSYATAGMAARDSEVSGDSARFFGNDATFFSLISDGMGSGREARECSDFACSYLSDLLLSEVGISTAASALSHIIRQREGECTATLDLFRLDLTTLDALFIKSGAAPSYVKRGSSIFRIRSETAPIGLMKNVDAEKIRVEIKSGDIVIMLSDGVASSVEDSAWLISYLSKDAPSDMEEYAKEIVRLAAKRSGASDDLTVSVVKITSKE